MAADCKSGLCDILAGTNFVVLHLLPSAFDCQHWLCKFHTAAPSTVFLSDMLEMDTCFYSHLTGFRYSDTFLLFLHVRYIYIIHSLSCGGN